MSVKDILLKWRKTATDATLVDAIYELEFRQSVEEGLSSLDRGERIPWKKPATHPTMDFQVFLSDGALSDLERIVAYLRLTMRLQRNVWVGNCLMPLCLSAPFPSEAVLCRVSAPGVA